MIHLVAGADETIRILSLASKPSTVQVLVTVVVEVAVKVQVELVVSLVDSTLLKS